MMKREQGTGWLNGWLFLMNGIAGFMNVVTLVQFNMPTTHFTGHLSRAGIDLMQSNGASMLWTLSAVTCFVLGSVLSGYLFADRVFYLKRRYGIVLMLLGGGHLLLTLLQLPIIIVSYCAFCAGVQNGLFIFYRGALVRTTHFTGYLTDIGFELGRVLKGQCDAFWKVKFYLVSILCFMIGGMGATFLGIHALDLIGWGYWVAGCYYFLFRKYFYNRT